MCRIAPILVDVCKLTLVQCGCFIAKVSLEDSHIFSVYSVSHYSAVEMFLIFSHSLEWLNSDETASVRHWINNTKAG